MTPKYSHGFQGQSRSNVKADLTSQHTVSYPQTKQLQLKRKLGDPLDQKRINTWNNIDTNVKRSLTMYAEMWFGFVERGI